MKDNITITVTITVKTRAAAKPENNRILKLVA